MIENQKIHYVMYFLRCLFMGKIIRPTIDFLYVKGNRLSAHKLPMIRPPTGTYYLTYNVTLRKLVYGCLGLLIGIPVAKRQ